MAKFQDVTGQKFGRLTALRRIGINSCGNAIWEFVCECGTTKEQVLYLVKSGKTRSCGCLRREGRSIHGHTKRKEITDTYKTWSYIKTRCFNPNYSAYKSCGGRGITMCERWKDSFENFLEDMGERPSKKHSIDRIDNEKGYEPGNCKWATRKEQSRNNRRNVWIEFNGQKKTICNWADELGIKRSTLCYRIVKAGWDVEKAFTTPTKTTK